MQWLATHINQIKFLCIALIISGLASVVLCSIAYINDKTIYDSSIGEPAVVISINCNSIRCDYELLLQNKRICKMYSKTIIAIGDRVSVDNYGGQCQIASCSKCNYKNWLTALLISVCVVIGGLFVFLTTAKLATYARPITPEPAYECVAIEFKREVRLSMR